MLLPEPRNEIEELAQRYYRDELNWLERMESLLQIHLSARRTREAAVVARIAAQAFPMDPAPNFAAGHLLQELQQPARARRYLERARRSEPPPLPARSGP